MTAAKRLLDVLASAVGLVVLAPGLAVVAALVALDGGPVIFGQERVGRRGRPFRMWKFRTMVVDAERRGPPLTVGADPRITRAGAWLRRYKLDELPQLVNVLRGEMTLVGPRPEVRRYVARYTAQQRRVLDLVPGITDPASVRFRDESLLLAGAADPEAVYIDRLVPEKIRVNLDYAARATVWSDLLVILTTIAGLVASVRTPGAGRASTPPRRWDNSHVHVEQ
jgi:lipopolysaccharide/colanic/teichoic acid biosynthesis glycosyltransferase